MRRDHLSARRLAVPHPVAHLERLPSPGPVGVIIAMNHVSQVDTLPHGPPRLAVGAGPPVHGQVGCSVGRSPGRSCAGRGRSRCSAARTMPRVAARGGRRVAARRGGGDLSGGHDDQGPANWPMLAKTGIARLVLMSPDTSVVPVGQWGAHTPAPSSSRSPPSSAAALAGLPRPPPRPDPLPRHEAKPANLREITDTIMTAVPRRGCRAALRDKPPARVLQTRHGSTSSTG